MSAQTAKAWTVDRAPKRITLRGDKTRPEPAQHIIEFPGGAIELTRLDDGNYWAHIIVNRRQFAGNDGHGLNAARGEVIDARIDHQVEGVCPVDGHRDIEQIAVLIKATREGC